MDLLNLNIDSNNRSLSSQVRESILAMIKIGTLQPGAKLPSSRRLAEYNDLHRETVSKALLELVEEGWLYSAPKRGYFVVDPLPTDYFISSPSELEGSSRHKWNVLASVTPPLLSNSIFLEFSRTQLTFLFLNFDPISEMPSVIPEESCWSMEKIRAKSLC